MTREEAISTAPRTRREYRFHLAFSAIFLLICVAEAMYAHKISVMILCVLSAFILLVSTLQANERLFFPQRAARRSLRLATSQPLQILIASIGWLWWIVFLLFVATFLISRPGQPILWWLQTSFGLPPILLFILNDLHGMRPPADDQAKEYIPVEELKPLQSQHWGESGDHAIPRL